jgi:hypothetical protein
MKKPTTCLSIFVKSLIGFRLLDYKRNPIKL